MPNITTVIYGPAGCGKTQNAATLRDYFKCSGVVDGWTPDQEITPDHLHLTNQRPTLKIELPFTVLSFERAMFMISMRSKGGKRNA